MNIEIRFMGVIADITGTRAQTLEFEQPPTLRGLLGALEDQHGPEFGARIYRSAKPPRLLQMGTRIFVNEKVVDGSALDQALPDPADSQRSPKVLVYFLPAACGG